MAVICALVRTLLLRECELVRTYSRSRLCITRIHRNIDSLVKKGFTFDNGTANLNHFILEMSKLKNNPQKFHTRYEEARYYHGKKNDPDVLKEVDSRAW